MIFLKVVVLLLLYVAVVAVVASLSSNVINGDYNTNRFERRRIEFPSDFLFGASSSAFQVEGAASEDGRTPSIFDTFANSSPNPGNGNVTSDQYHKYKEDVELMAETGLDAYRFSISWSRLIPNGRGAVNPKGLEYYNNLINALISKGIEPHVTLMHSDTPQVLEDEYEGFVSPRIIEDFVAYADVCFREFGDRVLHWTTFNEPNIFMFGGYDAGNSPPCRCSFPFGTGNCTKGNSILEPYLAAHHLLLAHASTVKLYKDNYQGRQHGFIGFNLYAYGFIPFSNMTEDVTATQRTYDFFIGWFMEPLVYGDYPAIMKKNAGSKLPMFTRNETELLKESSLDFIGLNYYAVVTVKDNPTSLTKKTRDYMADMSSSWIYGNNPFGGEPLLNTPWGLQGVLEYFKQAYGNPPVYIHENGQVGDQSKDYNTSLNDQLRVEYLQGHIGAVLDALRNGSNMQGYFVWSFLDMYELLFGTRYTFGLYYIDFNDPKLTRHPRLSQRWYSKFLKAGKASIARENTSAASRRNSRVVGLNSS